VAQAIRRNLVTLLIALLPWGIVGCDGQDAVANANPGGKSGAVRLGYFANVTHAQAVLGVDSGDFAKAIAPAELSTKVFNAGPSAMEALLAGQIDVTYVGPGPALNAHQKSRGRGVRVIAGAARNGVVVVAGKDSGITKLTDLKGKRVATPQLGNTQDIAARHYLKFDLGQTSLDNVLPVANVEQSALMLRGQIDAAWVPEPWGARLVADTGARIIGEEKDVWPDKQFDLTVIATTPEYLAKHGDVIAKLLGVHRAWTKRLTNDPSAQSEPLNNALAKLTGKPLSPAILKEALGRVAFTDEPSAKTFEVNAKWAADLGLMRWTVDTSTLINRTVLDKLKKDVETVDAGR
jgi:NitT/TauT family transport system substrate-binding protein